jgi:hypothetical protein
LPSLDNRSRWKRSLGIPHCGQCYRLSAVDDEERDAAALDHFCGHDIDDRVGPGVEASARDDAQEFLRGHPLIAPRRPVGLRVSAVDAVDRGAVDDQVGPDALGEHRRYGVGRLPGGDAAHDDDLARLAVLPRLLVRGGDAGVCGIAKGIAEEGGVDPGDHDPDLVGGRLVDPERAGDADIPPGLAAAADDDEHLPPPGHLFQNLCILGDCVGFKGWYEY